MRYLIPAVLFCLAMAACAAPAPRTAAPPVTPSAAARSGYDAASLERGRAIYLTACVRCHRARLVGDYSAAQWRDVLPVMARKSRLTAAQERDVTAYVLTLRAAGTPQADHAAGAVQ